MTRDDPDATAERSASGEHTSEDTAQFADGFVPEVAALARVITAPHPREPAAEAPAPGPAPSPAPAPALPPAQIIDATAHTTAIAAMRDEEIERTRLFIRMGWALSVAAMATVPFVDAPPVMSLVFIVGLVLGMVISYGFHQAFLDPRRYTERALLVLAIICLVNSHITVLFYGAFTGSPLMIVIGIHFIGRTEAERIARWVFGLAVVFYAVIASLVITGAIRDPGVFAADREMDAVTLTTATVFVLGTFWIAYYTARQFRAASLAAIEDLRAATHLASQREAVMDELRADLERALRIGGPGRYTDQVVGPYHLGVVLGRGAIGEVYEATHLGTGADAAVKLLRRELLADPTQVARFLREVRAAGALDSPHAVRVLEASAADDQLPYLAMERLTGRTLAELLRDEPRLSPAATLELCREVAAGLDVAAAAGIVHRDLKPQNLLRAASPAGPEVWKLLDFGAATLAEDSGTLTQGGVVGTPHYMAPEQARGMRVDARADLYALAAIVYRCTTGSHPFNAADTPALLYAVVHRAPLRPGALAELPPDLDRWCALALAKSPEDRFATGAALAAALAAAFAGALDPKLRRRADALIRRLPWEGA